MTGYWSPLRGSNKFYSPRNPRLAKPRLGLSYDRCSAASTWILLKQVDGPNYVARCRS